MQQTVKEQVTAILRRRMVLCAKSMIEYAQTWRDAKPEDIVIMRDTLDAMKCAMNCIDCNLPLLDETVDRLWKKIPTGILGITSFFPDASPDIENREEDLSETGRFDEAEETEKNFLTSEALV